MTQPSLKAFAALAALCSLQLAAQPAWARGGHSSSHSSSHASHAASHEESHGSSSRSEPSPAGGKPAPKQGQGPTGGGRPPSRGSAGGWGWWWSARPRRHAYFYAHTANGHSQGQPCDPQALAPATSGADGVDLGRAQRADCVARDDDDFQDNNSGLGRSAAWAAGGAGALGLGALGAAAIRRRRKMGGA